MSDKERQIRMEIYEVENMLRKAELIKPNEYLYKVHTEPGELILTVGSK